MIPGVGGGGGGGASIKAGGTTIDFPAPVAPSKSPITINTPPAYYPQVMHDPSKNKPVLIVPEIIYPKKKKRIIVHHNVPMMNYYHNMFYNKISPYYMQMAKSNANWAPMLENNDFYNQIAANQHYKPAMEAMKASFPDAVVPTASSSSGSSSYTSSSGRLII
jgi:hypothetical protein